MSFYEEWLKEQRAEKKRKKRSKRKEVSGPSSLREHLANRSGSSSSETKPVGYVSPYARSTGYSGSKGTSYGYGYGSYDYKSYDKNYSHSSSWTSRFSWDSGGSSTDKLNDALKTIARTVYVLGAKERCFKLKYQEDTNQEKYFLGPIITFDKGIVTNYKTGFNGDQKTDVLCGDALIKSGLRLVVTDTKKALEVFEDPKKDRSTLYQCTEEKATKDYILQECPGYVPYLLAKTNYFFDEKQFEKTINEPNKYSSAVFAMASALVAEEKELDFKTYQKDIDDLLKNLIGHKDTPHRIKATDEVLEELKRRYPEPDATPQPQPNSMTGLGKPGDLDGATPADDKNIVAADDKKSESKASKAGPGTPSAVITKHDFVNKLIDSLYKPKVRYTRFPTQISAFEDLKNSFSYDREKQRVQNLINTLKSSLVIRNTEAYLEERGLRSGYLDEGCLEKLSYDSPLVFERKEVIAKPKISVTILVDESGSMGSNNRYQSARAVAIALYEAFSSVDGIQVGVYGHTGDGHHYGTMDLFIYKTPIEGAAKNLSCIKARSNNYDGHAIRATTKNMQNWIDPDNKKNLLFLLSDGLPSAHEYRGQAAIRDIKKACTEAIDVGIDVYGIGIDNPYREEKGIEMFGADRFVILPDVMSSARVIGSFVSRILQK